MLQTELCKYKKAYVELLEILKYLTPSQKQKIPADLINQLEENKDISYQFEYDFSKNLLEQNLLTETKSLLLQLYIKYLSPENEKKFWNDYKILCLKKINSDKEKIFNSQNIFNKTEKTFSAQNNVDNLSITIQKEKLYIKIFKMIKNLFWR